MIRFVYGLLVATLAAAAACAIGLLADTAAVAAPVRYKAPPETPTLAAGPNVELARAHCGVCHSVDYITTQPRSYADPRATWTAEVAKMRKTYGATLTDEDAAKIVDYLVVTYGR